MLLEYAQLTMVKRGRLSVLTREGFELSFGSRRDRRLVSAELRPDGLVLLRVERNDGDGTDFVIDPDQVLMITSADPEDDAAPGNYQ